MNNRQSGHTIESSFAARPSNLSHSSKCTAATNKVTSAKTTTSKITALYSRLSREDEATGDSLSIQNQRAILEEHARKNGFDNIRHFVDDGTTGVHFERDGWQELIAGVEAGNVAVCILKDMTRFGRDYIKVGEYMELFRRHGVRFIAIGHNIDSINPDSLEFAPFINIMSEWYSRDNSRKLKAVFKAKGNSGKRITNHAIYGYTKDPEDRTKWVIDEEAAAIVRRIFQMTIEGIGPHQIARQLSLEKIFCPSYYLAQRGQGTMKTRVIDDPCLWRGSTVRGFIEKPEYMGDTVNFRWYKDSYKDRRAKKTPDDEIVIFKDTHPAIVDRETWHTAQRCRKTVRRTDSLGEANPLTGILFCAQCGAKMYNKRDPHTRDRRAANGRIHKRSPQDYYNCSSYKLAMIKYTRQCTSHFIQTAHVRELVLGVIKRVSSLVRENEAKFIKQVREDSAIQHEAAVKSHRKQLAKSEKRYVELDNIIRGLYEDKISGVLTPKRFETLAAGYESEQEQLETLIANLRSEIGAFEVDSNKADKFINIVKKYTDFTELTAPMLHEFVEKILVHEMDKSSGERVQKVDIYLNFIGKFDIPEPELTPEELAEIEQRRAKREKRREYHQRYMAKKARLQEEAEANNVTA